MGIWARVSNRAPFFTYHAAKLTPAFVVAAPALGVCFLREEPVQTLFKSGPEIKFRLRLGLALARAQKSERAR